MPSAVAPPDRRLLPRILAAVVLHVLLLSLRIFVEARHVLESRLPQVVAQKSCCSGAFGWDPARHAP